MKDLNGSRTVNILQKIFKFREWTDFDRVKAFFYALLHSLKILLIPQAKKKSKHKFEEAVEQLSLTNDELLVKSRALFRWSIVMLCIAAMIFLYAVYQLALNSYLSFGVSFSLTGVALAFAFRYHFWFYQIQQRRLGCSLKEWFMYLVKGKNL